MANFGTLSKVICTNLIQGYDTIVTSAAVTILTSTSNRQQYFTGTSTHSIKLPITSTLALGMSYSLFNKSTNSITVLSSGDDIIYVILAAGNATFTCISTSGTTAASWSTITANITSVTGTNNQITVSPSTENVVIGLSPSVITDNLNLSGLTASQSVVTNSSRQLTSILNSTASTASSIALRNNNANILANNIIQGYNTIVTSGGTTILTVASLQQQYFTGTDTEIVILPATSTLVLGQSYIVTNNSTQLVTVLSSGNNVISILNPGTTNTLTCVSTSGAGAFSWSGGNIGTFLSASGPSKICFDGVNIWVTNFTSSNVTKIIASTGIIVGSYAVGTNPLGICFDGTNIWVSNSGNNNVTKILSSNGSIVGTYAVGTNPRAICFDGNNIWVVNTSSNNVTKLLASTGALINNFATGSNPQAICFDGSNIWIANNSDNNITKLLASTGVSIGIYNVGINPTDIYFEGNNIWVSNGGSNNVTKLLASDGSLIGTYPTGINPQGISFDGTNIWVANFTSNNLTKILSSTGNIIGTYVVETNPFGICFDGTNIWSANMGSNNINQITEVRDSGLSQVQPSTIGVPLLSTFNNISRDLYANTQINNLVSGYSSTPTSGGTSFLSVMSPYQQYFTGTSTQIITLPDVTTLNIGHSFKIVNRSTNSITINSSGGNLLKTLTTMTWGRVVCILTTGTTASSWSYEPGSNPVI